MGVTRSQQSRVSGFCATNRVLLVSERASTPPSSQCVSCSGYHRVFPSARSSNSDVSVRHLSVSRSARSKSSLTAPCGPFQVRAHPAPPRRKTPLTLPESSEPNGFRLRKLKYAQPPRNLLILRKEGSDYVIQTAKKFIKCAHSVVVVVVLLDGGC